MKKIDVVIGLNYGDEGKGLTTDYLVSRGEVPDEIAVVRFNGGAQAGHTVNTPTQRHVFHHIGSGSLQGAATILSRFFVVNPVLYMLERTEFGRLNIYVDPECIVTTPYDVMINRAREKHTKNGSCGIGFAETIKRNEIGFSIRVKDLKNPLFVQNMLSIIRRDYFYPLMRGLNAIRPDITKEFLDGAEQRFLDDCALFLKTVIVKRDVEAMEWFDHLVFEGAQGLRLDQYSEDFPHVTRSSTGLENVAKLLEGFDCDTTVYYVTRSYLTRHGVGPLDNEIQNPGYVDETNVHNQYQGGLRYATHDFDRMARDVAKDKQFYPNAKFKVAVTWANETMNLSGILNAVGVDSGLLAFTKYRDGVINFRGDE